ncbi:hypothetical protein BD408DRAFT_422384 [Parasitella parasitica]|nr:hypothetical protein BD408DRAFT_422384 [Parasitella parasitica]
MSTWKSQLSPKESEYFTQLFDFVSKQQKGIVTGAEAVRFFATSGVPTQILSEIWEAADRDKGGYLTPETFSIALKLIACAQHGKEADTNVLSTVVPLPQFDVAVVPSPVVPNASAATPITPAEREKYAGIFKVHQPANGVLDGDTAREVFIKSKLPMETLSQIWILADVRQSGSLNQTEFIIAMHYIAKLMDGTLTSLPDRLPPAVYQSANGDAATSISSASQSPMMRNMSITSPSFRNTRQQSIMTPPQRARTIDSLGNLAFGPSASIHETVQQWDVSAQEKQQFDAYFDKIDSNKTEAIQGKEAVEFFKNSRLPETDLAHVWDLADIQQKGALSRDEFAVAMHLIHKRLAGEQLPQILPKTLIPPSNRPTIQQSPFGNSPAFAPASPAVFASPAPVSHSLSLPPPPQQQQQQQQQRSLIDDGNAHDLLGDFGNDQISHETNQVNILQNQISSLSMQKADLSSQKQSAEGTLERLAKQKKDLEAQLTNVRMAHESVVKDLNEIQETVRREEGEWDKVRAEYDAAQQQLTALQNEIAQVQQTLQNGRAETESLRRRVNEIQQETNAATADLEKMRAQNKQQNMMLDINRRQVTAAEQDRAQARRHLEDYKMAGNLNQEEDNETDEDESIFADTKPDSVDADAAATATSPEATPSVVSTPALNNLFGDSPAPKSTPSPFASSSPFYAFTPPTATATVSASNDDFDAIFGNMGSTSATTPPVEAFDPTAWATSATTPTTSFTKSSRGPPPPPPQSRHHRQPSESVSSVNSATSPSTISKKQRAPPPPPPPSGPSGPSAPQQTPSQIEENSDEDDFEVAFSGKLSEAKVVSKGVDKDEFADFDDAFSAFDIKPAQQPKATADVPASVSATNDNWASSFGGGFSFSGKDDLSKNPALTTTETAADEDWDSIFGSAAPPTASVNQASSAATSTVNSNGFDDAFSSFGGDFGKQSPVVPSPTSNSKGKQPANESASPPVNAATARPVHSIGIVGDKIEELVKMGFAEQEAKDALNRYDQDLEKASNFLLDQS